MKKVQCFAFLCVVFFAIGASAMDYSPINQLQNQPTFNGQVPLLYPNPGFSVTFGNKTVKALFAPTMINNGACVAFVDELGAFYFHCGPFTIKEK